MNQPVYKVIIVGGTGLLGYHAGLEFLRRGCEVTALSIPDIDLGGWFPREVEVIYGDVFKMTSGELSSIFRKFDAMVYAIGPDDRSAPRIPAEPFYRERLVEKCTQVFESARKAGVKRAVLLNSYFAHFNRIWPHLELTSRHTYIHARVEQAREAVRISEPGMDTMVLEIPYVFGTMPNRTPLWKEGFLDRLLRMNPVFYPDGGSAMMRVENVAEAIVGAVEHGDHGTRYALGDINMRWKEMLHIMFGAIGVQRRVFQLPGWIASMAGRMIMVNERKRGRESGLNMQHVFKDIIGREFFLDPRESMALLGYGSGNVRQAIEASAIACYPLGYGRNATNNEEQ